MNNSERDHYLTGLCFITDRGTRARSVFDISAEVINSGVKWIQLRDKHSTRKQIFKAARMLKTLTAINGVTLIINDHPDIALAVDADGVHLGQDDLPLKEARKIMGKKIIGVSTHNPEEALAAQREGADYIGFGSIYPTKTKNTGQAVGIGLLKELVQQIDIPVVAIGGIKEKSLEEVFKAGASAVAVASGIGKRRDQAKAASTFVQIIKEMKA